MRWRPGWGGLLAVASTALAGCELREISLTEPERAVVAEAYVRLAPSAFSADAGAGISVFLHETLGPAGSSGPVPGARITIVRSDGFSIPFHETALGSCTIATPVDGDGTCYEPSGSEAALGLAPGDRLALRIELPDGGVLTSETTVPGRFELVGLAEAFECAVSPRTATALVWSRSAGAWAYISDTFISGMNRVFPADRVDDPLYLWGLSVSAQDTTIVFPREFGVFSRGELDREVSLSLQAGLPDRSTALVTIAAVDRNWVNWSRGGNFNPSGVVRVPSVRGDGTGVFAAAVLRSFRVLSESAPRPGVPPCPPAPPIAQGS